MAKILIFLSALVLAGVEAQVPWWYHSVVYQIYPRSFQDSDGDGVGDLKGIESRLDHLVDIGVDTVWISPIYESPMVDFGYDVSDYRQIDPLFGDLDDFRDLVDAMHGRDLKLVLDFIPNHSSDQHDWFVRSEAGEDPYTDYYVWLDPPGEDESGAPSAPNNWVSRFDFSAWNYSQARGQFYLHQYTPEQPDLNYRSPSVLSEMSDVLRYWLDLGVDGFRMDAVLGIFEDGRFLDEPLSGLTDDPNNYDYLDHVYTWDQDETREIALATFYNFVKSYTEGQTSEQDKVVMLEAYFDEDLYEYSDFPFNFGIVELDSTPSPSQLRGVVEGSLREVPEGGIPNWVLGNHDTWRVATRFDERLVDAFNVISLALPGVAVTYQGEEIGMTNNMDISYEETVDPRGLNCGPEDYLDPGCSRDPERTPMQWTPTGGDAAGFTRDGADPWLPINSNFETVNVETQSGDPSSHLAIYKAMVQIRKDYLVTGYGETTVETQGDVIWIRRFFPDTDLNSSAYLWTLVSLDTDPEGDTEVIDLGGGQGDGEGVVVLDTAGSAGSLADLRAVAVAPGQIKVIAAVGL